MGRPPTLPGCGAKEKRLTRFSEWVATSHTMGIRCGVQVGWMCREQPTLWRSWKILVAGASIAKKGKPGHKPG